MFFIICKNLIELGFQLYVQHNHLLSVLSNTFFVLLVFVDLSYNSGVTKIWLTKKSGIRNTIWASCVEWICQGSRWHTLDMMVFLAAIVFVLLTDFLSACNLNLETALDNCVIGIFDLFHNCITLTTTSLQLWMRLTWLCGCSIVSSTRPW